MIKTLKTLLTMACTASFLLAGCAEIDATKTGRGYYAPTNPNTVDILFTRPERKYVELGAVTATKHQPHDTAKMHNTLRTKAAPLGASAVIILNQGFDANNRLWATGVAIRYESGAAEPASKPAAAKTRKH